MMSLALLVITARAFCYQAEVTDISGTKYFPAVKGVFFKAEKSIYVVMFTIESSLSKQDSKPNQLIDALIEVKNRGVDVEVILDQNVDFVNMPPAVSDRRVPRLLWGEPKIKSTRVYKRLKDAGIKVYYDEPAGVYGIPNEQYFDLPDDYFKLGWNRELSLRAKFCYLINLAYSDISDIKPYWSKSVTTITKQFGDVGRDVIHKGMAELRRKKLLEVKYDELSGKRYEERRLKMYKILKLYDPKEREIKLKAIEDKYGKDAYAKARKYAEIVFEENNPEAIEDVILKTKEYGEKEVKRVFGEIARKNIDNPKRNYVYVTRILGKAEDAQP